MSDTKTTKPQTFTNFSELQDYVKLMAQTTFIFDGKTGEAHYRYKGIRIAARFFEKRFPVVGQFEIFRTFIK